MEIHGFLKQVCAPVPINTKNGVKDKVTFIVELTPAGEQYPQSIAVETFNANVAQFIQGYQIGAPITVVCDCYAREFNGKYYNSINAWNAYTPQQ